MIALPHRPSSLPLHGAVSRRGRGGYSLVEVLAALAIFLIGIVSILNFFPNILRAQNEALLLTSAALLGQEKVMEVRRDDRSGPGPQTLIEAIRARTVPTDPIIFPREPRLAYAFHSRSLLDPVDDSNNPNDDFDVARVIIIKVEQNRIPTLANVARWEILAEIRFDQGP
jgi:prepilin-type N-terminal cleavage/methylation domain-containing protein